MPETAGQERTEKATRKKREDARKKGQVAVSKEVSSVMVLLASLGILYFAGAWMFWRMSDLIARVYQNIGTIRFGSVADASAFSLEVLYRLSGVLLPFLLPIALVGIISNVMQIGFKVSTEAMELKLTKLNPISGMKRFVSLKSLVELCKSIIKLIFVGGIAYLVVKGDLKEFSYLVQQEVGQIVLFIARVSLKLFFFVCLALIVIAVLDYIYQRWQYEQDLKMTKEEVKDEFKQNYGDPKVKARIRGIQLEMVRRRMMEAVPEADEVFTKEEVKDEFKQNYGDPKVKARIRGIQLEMARRRMMEAVPEADVVITNPTHLAIALKFDAWEMIAPRVVAKGVGYLAQRIRGIAEESRIPIVEEKPLAQLIFKMVDIGSYIPTELYPAVAEVLAYVYRHKGMHKMV